MWSVLSYAHRVAKWWWCNGMVRRRKRRMSNDADEQEDVQDVQGVQGVQDATMGGSGAVFPIGVQPDEVYLQNNASTTATTATNATNATTAVANVLQPQSPSHATSTTESSTEMPPPPYTPPPPSCRRRRPPPLPPLHTYPRRCHTQGTDIYDTYFDNDGTLGKGSFGNVFTMTHRTTGDVVAVKMMVPRRKAHWKVFHNEHEILRTVDHPHIVRFREAFHNASCGHLVMDICPGQELFDRMVEKGPYTEQATKPLLIQLLDAVLYLHTRPSPIAHLDIKPENIFIDESQTPAHLTLIDFGLAAQRNTAAALSRLTDTAGTISYCAPEIVDDTVETYDGTMADAWSCAIVTYIMLAACPPFYARTERATIRKVCQVDYSFAYPEFSSVSTMAKEYMQRTFVRNVGIRWSVGRVRQSKWLRG